MVSSKITVELTLDTADFRKGLAKARGKIKGATTDTKKQDTATKGLAGAFFKANVSMAVFSRGLGLLQRGIGKSIKQFTQFETGIAKVNTLLVGQGTQAIKGIQEELLRLDSRLGSTQELTEATYQAISAGVEPAKAVEFVGRAAKLAKAGFTDMNTAVDAVTTVINAYGLSLDDTTRITDVFITTQNLGKTTVAEFGAVIGSVLPLAAEAGVGIEEMGAAIATLTASGIDTNRTMTGLRAIFASLIKITPEATKQAKDLGIDFSLAALKSKGLAKFLRDVTDATGGSTEKLARLFPNLEAIVPVLALGGEQADSFAEKLLKMGKASGAIDEAFNIVTDTIKEDFNAAIVELGVVVIEVVAELEPLLRDLIGKFRDVIEVLKFFTGVQDKITRSGLEQAEATRKQTAAFLKEKKSIQDLEVLVKVATTRQRGLASASAEAGKDLRIAQAALASFNVTSSLTGTILEATGITDFNADVRATGIIATTTRTRLEAQTDQVEKLQEALKKAKAEQALFNIEQQAAITRERELEPFEEIDPFEAVEAPPIAFAKQTAEQKKQQQAMLEEVRKRFATELELLEARVAKEDKIVEESLFAGLLKEDEFQELSIRIFDRAEKDRQKIKKATEDVFDTADKSRLNKILGRGQTELEALANQKMLEADILQRALESGLLIQTAFDEELLASKKFFIEEEARLKKEARELDLEATRAEFDERHNLLSGLAEANNLFHDNQINLAMAQAEVFEKFVVGAFESVQGAISDTVFAAITGAGGIDKIWKSLGNSILKSIIDSLVQMAAQFVITRLIAGTASKSLAAQEMSKASGLTFAHAFASAVQIPIIGPLVAPGIAAEAVAAMQAGAAVSAVAGSAIGATFMQRGIDLIDDDVVPAVLHRGERVVPATTNRDLSEFLAEQRRDGGGRNVHLSISIDTMIGNEDFVADLTQKISDEIKFQNIFFEGASR